VEEYVITAIAVLAFIAVASAIAAVIIGSVRKQDDEVVEHDP
jgi:hypothetical protein